MKKKRKKNAKKKIFVYSKSTMFKNIEICILDLSQANTCSKDVKMAANLGVEYAWASGDWNPHHLYPITARLYGFKKPCIQGMWTISRALAELENSGNV